MTRICFPSLCLHFVLQLPWPHSFSAQYMKAFDKPLPKAQSIATFNTTILCAQDSWFPRKIQNLSARYQETIPVRKPPTRRAEMKHQEMWESPLKKPAWMSHMPHRPADIPVRVTGYRIFCLDVDLVLGSGVNLISGDSLQAKKLGSQLQLSCALKVTRGSRFSNHPSCLTGDNLEQQEDWGEVRRKRILHLSLELILVVKTGTKREISETMPSKSETV